MNRRRIRNDTLFLLGLLLAGGLELLDGPWVSAGVSTLLVCLGYCLYMALLLAWMTSLYRSLLPSRARREIVAAGVFMLFFLGLRVFKYRVCLGAPEANRWCWYLYYLPFLMVPTLFAMSCISMNRPGPERRRGWEWLLLLPAALITLLVLTNDLHLLSFRPVIPGALFTGEDGSYRYGPVAYAAFAWAVGMLLLGAWALIRATRRAGLWRGFLGPLTVLALWGAALLAYQLLGKFSWLRPYHVPEIHVFAMLGIFEACFRSRRIPRNRDYEQVFRSLRLPAAVTDPELNLVYPTAETVPVEPGQLRQALETPCLLDQDHRLHGKRLDQGYGFWVEDESTLNRLNEALEEVNEALAQENELIAREREQKEEAEAVEARNRLYTRAAQAVYPAQKRIARLLEAAEPDTPGFRACIAKVLALTAYVKRTSNFVMVEAERESVTAGELGAALQESAHYLSYCGVSASVDVTAQEDIPCGEARALYDCFETVIEALHSQTEELWIRLSDKALLLMADCAEPPVLPALPAAARTRWEDGQLTLTLEKGGEAL